MLTSRVMILRLSVVCAVLLPTAACDDTRDIAGQYVLTREDSAGTPVTAAGGELTLCGNGRYIMSVTHRDEHGNWQPVVVSSGEYRWFGVTLMLLDSGDLAPMTASVESGVIIVQNDDHEYEFLRLVQLPPASPPDWCS
jgi:hypothetical protein